VAAWVSWWLLVGRVGNRSYDDKARFKCVVNNAAGYSWPGWAYDGRGCDRAHNC
jgi:hypothetical protein